MTARHGNLDLLLDQQEQTMGAAIVFLIRINLKQRTKYSFAWKSQDINEKSTRGRDILWFISLIDTTDTYQIENARDVDRRLKIRSAIDKKAERLSTFHNFPRLPAFDTHLRLFWRRTLNLCRSIRWGVLIP